MGLGQRHESASRRRWRPMRRPLAACVLAVSRRRRARRAVGADAVGRERLRVPGRDGHVAGTAHPGRGGVERRRTGSARGDAGVAGIRGPGPRPAGPRCDGRIHHRDAVAPGVRPARNGVRPARSGPRDHERVRPDHGDGRPGRHDTASGRSRPAWTACSSRGRPRLSRRRWCLPAVACGSPRSAATTIAISR